MCCGTESRCLSSWGKLFPIRWGMKAKQWGHLCLHSSLSQGNSGYSEEDWAVPTLQPLRPYCSLAFVLLWPSAQMWASSGGRGFLSSELTVIESRLWLLSKLKLIMSSLLEFYVFFAFRMAEFVELVFQYNQTDWNWVNLITMMGKIFFFACVQMRVCLWCWGSNLEHSIS